MQYSEITCSGLHYQGYMGGKACWQALETDGCGLQPSLAMNLWALKSFRPKHKKLFSTLKPYAPPGKPGPHLDPSFVIYKIRAVDEEIFR